METVFLESDKNSYEEVISEPIETYVEPPVQEQPIKNTAETKIHCTDSRCTECVSKMKEGANWGFFDIIEAIIEASLGTARN